MLGFMLFILYVNDICNLSNLLFDIMFADDTSVLLSGNNQNGLICFFNESLLYAIYCIKILGTAYDQIHLKLLLLAQK